MSPSRRQPSEPDRGRPEQGEVELEAAESAQAEAQEAAAEKAKAPKPKPKRASRKKPKEAEGTAAEKTGVDKPVAEAGESTEPDEPAVEPQPDETVAQRADAPDEEPAQASAAEEVAAEAAAKRSPRAARRRRDRRPSPVAPDRDGAQATVQVRAHARFVRSSARKARLVSDHIRGKSVQEARAILAHAQRDGARDWTKLLESAVANAEHNHELVEDDLHIQNAFADEGPTLKRFQPRAQGRATRIRKRTSHLTITLTPKGGTR